jgi:hypothetical protein
VVKQNRPTEEAYAELQYAYDFYNKELFDGQLTSCLLTYQRSKRTFGYFSKDRFGHRDARKTHELALNPEYFAVVPLIEVLQTLVHEMTHLWQEHFGKSTLARALWQEHFGKSTLARALWQAWPRVLSQRAMGQKNGRDRPYAVQHRTAGRQAYWTIDC